MPEVLDINVDINQDVNQNDKGEFVNGKVTFLGTIKMTDGSAVPEALTIALYEDGYAINLSRLGTNTKCNMALNFLHYHDHHAPQFYNEEDMQEYLHRVQGRIEEVSVIAESIAKEIMLV